MVLARVRDRFSRTTSVLRSCALVLEPPSRLELAYDGDPRDDCRRGGGNGKLLFAPLHRARLHSFAVRPRVLGSGPIDRSRARIDSNPCCLARLALRRCDDGIEPARLSMAKASGGRCQMNTHSLWYLAVEVEQASVWTPKGLRRLLQ